MQKLYELPELTLTVTISLGLLPTKVTLYQRLRETGQRLLAMADNIELEHKQANECDSAVCAQAPISRLTGEQRQWWRRWAEVILWGGVPTVDDVKMLREVLPGVLAEMDELAQLQDRVEDRMWESEEEWAQRFLKK